MAVPGRNDPTRDFESPTSLPVAITKEHVNAVARAMGAGMTAFADGDLLLGASVEEESRVAAHAYQEKTFGKRS